MDRIPTAKAMSVAVGMPQPLAARVPWFTSVKTRAGTATPPKAAMIGRIAFLNDESSPQTTSRLISRPTVKKKITIRMSLMNFSTVMSRGNTQLMSPSGLLMFMVS